jgi:hypothetical protein
MCSPNQIKTPRNERVPKKWANQYQHAESQLASDWANYESLCGGSVGFEGNTALIWLDATPALAIGATVVSRVRVQARRLFDDWQFNSKNVTYTTQPALNNLYIPDAAHIIRTSAEGEERWNAIQSMAKKIEADQKQLDTIFLGAISPNIVSSDSGNESPTSTTTPGASPSPFKATVPNDFPILTPTPSRQVQESEVCLVISVRR